MTLYTCSRCQSGKPKESFCFDTRRPEGVSSWCKACKLKYTQERRARGVAIGGLDATVAARYWPKVEKRGEDECWPWLGAQAGKSPRGAILNHGKTTYAHRIAWMIAGGTAPVWPMVVDHTCRNGLCQNPKHLRVVTQRINTIENSSSCWAKNHAKTHCLRGHPFSPENTALIQVKDKRVHRSATRVCLTCRPHYRNSPRRIFRTDQEAA